MLRSLSSALVQVFVNLHTLLEPHHHQWQLQPLSTLIACFSECTGVNTTKQSWLQAELSPHRGDLGLRSLSHHSTAATFHLCATLNVPPQITHIWRHQLTVSISPSCPLTQFPLDLACSINPHNTTFQTSWKPILFQICLIQCLVITGQDCCQYLLHMRLRG